MGTLSARDRVRAFGDATVTGLVAAGTTQATATAVTADHVIVTSGTGGVILRPSSALDLATVANHTAVAISVYPPSGAAFNGATANLPLTLPANHAAFCVFLSTTIITVTLW